VLAGEQRDTAIDLAHHALAGGDLLTGEPSNPLAWLLAVEVLAWSDRLDEHERITRVAIADARRRGSVIAHALAGDARSHGHHLAGRLADAEADLRDAIAVYESHSPDLLRRAKARLASILIDQDQLHAAESALVAVADDPSEAPTLAQGLLLEVRSRLRLVQGRAREALDDALAAGRAMEAMLVRNPAICAWRSRAADVLLKLGDDARARDLAAEEVALARGFGSPRAIGVALRSAGLIEGRDLGLELLRESVAVLERSPAALEQARSSAELGAALRRRRSPRQARQPLRDALDRASRLGAGALAQRALDELVASGARPRRRELSGVGSLTASERRVAQMAATGMTNREIAGLLFVTTKAVQWHLRNVYLKLGTSERAELAEALADGDGTHDRVD
jgi:DNA-binding CsgD family transcriptional regulator